MVNNLNEIEIKLKSNFNEIQIKLKLNFHEIKFKLKLLRSIVLGTQYHYWMRMWFVMKYAVNKLTLFVCQMSFILAGQRREHKCGRRN